MVIGRPLLTLWDQRGSISLKVQTFTGYSLVLRWGISGPNHASMSLESSQHIYKFLPKRPYLVRQRQQYVSGGAHPLQPSL